VPLESVIEIVPIDFVDQFEGDPGADGPGGLNRPMLTGATRGLRAGLRVGTGSPSTEDPITVGPGACGNALGAALFARHSSFCLPTVDRLPAPLQRQSATRRSEVAPFQWTVCQLAVYVLVMAACMSAS
jgi:hypothetical protein